MSVQILHKTQPTVSTQSISKYLLGKEIPHLPMISGRHDILAPYPSLPYLLSLFLFYVFFFLIMLCFNHSKGRILRNIFNFKKYIQKAYISPGYAKYRSRFIKLFIH